MRQPDTRAKACVENGLVVADFDGVTDRLDR
jgi:hypothetical protein